MAHSLSHIQQWLITTLSTPSNLREGMQYAQERYNTPVHDIIAQKGGADTMTRLSVYANSYILRLIQCLEADFPALLNVMGHDLFRFFASTYIWEHPSSSTTLYDLGAGFADFLARTQPETSAQHSQMRLPLELAQLERLRTEVMRAKGTEREPRSFVPDPLLLLANPSLTLRTPPCLRLLELGHPLIGFLEAIDKGETHPTVPEPQHSYIAITRVQFRVSMYGLQAWQYHLIQAATATLPLTECVSIASERSDTPKETITAELTFWLPTAIEAGLVQTL